MTTHTTDEKNAQDLEIEMNAVIHNLDQTISDLRATSLSFDTIDQELDEADGLITTLSDKMVDFEDEKGDEIDSLVLNALVNEE